MTQFNLFSKAPEGELYTKWEEYKSSLKKLKPEEANMYNVVVIGTVLAGASASATLAESGFNVHAFSFHESPRRAHSIAAQGGINAAKNYQGDGDSVHRLFYDTVKGGDYRSREANVYRLAEVSANIIDQCVAQGVPFARDYGGLLDNRSFGGVLVQEIAKHIIVEKVVIVSSIKSCRELPLHMKMAKKTNAHKLHDQRAFPCNCLKTILSRSTTYRALMWYGLPCRLSLQKP